MQMVARPNVHRSLSFCEACYGLHCDALGVLERNAVMQHESEAVSECCTARHYLPQQRSSVGKAFAFERHRRKSRFETAINANHLLWCLVQQVACQVG